MLSGSEQVFAARESQKFDQIQSFAKRDLSHLDDKKLKEVSQEFESLFIKELFKSMKKTVGKDQWIDGGMKQEIFEDMLYTEYARMSAQQGGIGLGSMVYDFVKQSQKSIRPGREPINEYTQASHVEKKEKNPLSGKDSEIETPLL